MDYHHGLPFEPYVEHEGEEYMNPRQIAHFKTMLEQWKEQLLLDMVQTIHSMQDEVTLLPDVTDRATLESDMAIELRNRDRERKLIKKIDDALARIQAGEYGYCENCGTEIGLRRLEARPTATLCIDCKTLDEIREKQVAH
jgi:DnaK suppressor protein